ncbi:TPA: hypothetical protein O1J52_001364 [Escherichia coli]|uniref:hypothetical protein n=1 Tax=Escherichia coli TaxID=562 RepID=UPI001F6196B6|nr:hypothetical protein [Escherichia coli]EHP0635572.1 hypothetical protein [Escherichia coli]EJK2361719.1 hypothetical protein [Escherichia coli]MCI3593310.1 hypothetical protein [Escherichia coli]MCQ1641750.1 hypothetical protein [Escherichia coli]HCY2610721.1 hypothetical protein [Escherichia coli]
MTAKTIEVKCKCCPDTFIARVADRKRGWAQFCSKSCAAYWKQYGRRRGHQSVEMREAAIDRNNIDRLQRENSVSSYTHPREFVYVGGFGSWDDHKDC